MVPGTIVSIYIIAMDSIEPPRRDREPGASRPEQTPGFLVWRLSMKWRAAVDRAIASTGLTHAQYSLLASLLGMERASLRPTQRELADHTGLEPLHVSKLARTLASAGLVHRAGDPRDTRAVRLSLTPNGHDVAARAIAIVAQLHEQLLAPLGGPASGRAQSLASELSLLLAAPAASEAMSRSARHPPEE
jgi:DNA-binding MarR family transcriptional regulator